MAFDPSMHQQDLFTCHTTRIPEHEVAREARRSGHVAREHRSGLDHVRSNERMQEVRLIRGQLVVVDKVLQQVVVLLREADSPAQEIVVGKESLVVPPKSFLDLSHAFVHTSWEANLRHGVLGSHANGRVKQGREGTSQSFAHFQEKWLLIPMSDAEPQNPLASDVRACNLGKG